MPSPDAPVFLAGLAHSGKTPLRIALGRHPDLALSRKSALWTRFYNRFGDLSEPSRREACLATVLADHAVRSLAPDTEEIRRQFAAGPFEYARLFALIHRQHADALGKRRWGDQLGLIEAFAGPIFGHFPEARIVHMVRDPLERSGDRIRPRPGAIGWETAKWTYSARLARDNATRFAGRYLVLHYEQLIDQPVGALDSVCAFIGETATDEMHESIVSVAPKGGGAGLRRGQRRFVHRHADAYRRALGYDGGDTCGALSRPVDRAALAAWRLTRQRTFDSRVGVV